MQMKIALAVTVTLLLLGCSQEQHEEAKEKLSKSVDKITEVVKQESTKIVENVQDITEETVESSKKSIQDINQKVEKKSAEVIQSSADSIDKALGAKIDGSKIFVKCSSCHGQKAEKKALTKSQIIQGWSVSKITAAINGYKNGTYGASMKGVMKPQVSKLSDAEIQAVAKYISHL
jgi:cytochrome c553